MQPKRRSYGKSFLDNPKPMRSIVCSIIKFGSSDVRADVCFRERIVCHDNHHIYHFGSDSACRADKLEVSQSFLLQQAAWMYEQQLSQVRAQMRRVGSRQSSIPSLGAGSMTGSGLGGQHLKREGSTGLHPPNSQYLMLKKSQAPGPLQGCRFVTKTSPCQKGSLEVQVRQRPLQDPKVNFQFCNDCSPLI